MIPTPTPAQVDAVSRHAITIVATAATIFGLQAKGIDITVITDAIKAMGPVVNDMVVLLTALGPLYAAYKAAHSASPVSQVESVRAIATGPASDISVDAQKALISATGAVAQDKSIPTSQAAVDTLVAATIALPNVQTIVADETTAKNSPSPSVVPAPVSRAS